MSGGTDGVSAARRGSADNRRAIGCPAPTDSASPGDCEARAPFVSQAAKKGKEKAEAGEEGEEDSVPLGPEDIRDIIAKDENKRLVVVHGIVHDVTGFAPHHPGGSRVFVTGNGQDMSATFDAMHGPKAKAKLRHWAIGKYVDARPTEKAVAETPTGASASPPNRDAAAAAAAHADVVEIDIRAHMRENPKRLLLILFGDVYDVTEFASQHPGGMRVLESQRGKECGEAFMRIHSLRTRGSVGRYCIGRLKDAPPRASPLRPVSGLTTVDAERGGAAPVSATRMRAESARLLEVEPLETSSFFRYLTFSCPFRMNLPPGGHLKIYRDVDRGEEKCYTPFKVELASFTVCVKCYPNGKVSTYLFSLHEGDEVFYEGPFPPSWTPHTDPHLNHPRLANTEKHVLLLAGGTGVLPLYSIARDLLQRQATNVTLFCSVRSREELILGKELADVQRTHGGKGGVRCSIFFAFTQSFPAPASDPATASTSDDDDDRLLLSKEKTRRGRIDTKLLKGLPLPPTTQAVVICGPPSFNEAMVRCTVDAGLCEAKHIHVLQ